MPMSPYTSKVRVHDKYKVVGFISSGTYGRVYKAVSRKGLPGEFAIKKWVSGRRGMIDGLTVTDSSPTRKERSFSTPEYLNRHVEKWPCALNYPIPMLSIL